MHRHAAREVNSVAMAAGPVPQSFAPAGPPGPAPHITLDGIEVVQAIQDMGQSVLLVAEKQTLVRIYLSTGGSLAPITVRGILAVKPVGLGGSTPVSSIANVVLDPSQDGPAGLRGKREDLLLSLNFRVPSELLGPGDVRFELSNLETVNPNGPALVPPGAFRQVSFLEAIPLRIRVIGIRYQSPTGSGNEFEPAPIDYALIQSWLGRAYPVARVEWSQTVVDWPGTPPWPTPANLGTWGRDFVNPLLSNLRTQDVSAGTDHRTHFFALVADGGGFMRGWASAVPSSPDPTVVASGPAGHSGFPWDTDGSYADWYTGHELAHTFGRRHPGYCGGNSADDPAFPYPNGQIAQNNGNLVGYDPGDHDHLIPPRALPGTLWHDLMTYCDFQWLSAYTYQGIYYRLVAENSLPGPNSPGGGPLTSNPVSASAGGGMMSDPLDGIHVVARVNQTKGTAQFSYVTPVALSATAKQARAQASGYVVRVQKNGAAPSEYSAVFHRDACGDQSDTDVTGSLDLIVPNDSMAVALELVHDDTVLDIFIQGAEPPDPKDIRSASAGAGPVPTVSASRSASLRPRIAWTPSPVASAGAMPAAAMGVGGHRPLHTVQLSTDNGQTWRTIGVALVSPEVSLDPQLIAGKDTIQVRVTATNGFRTKTATKTLSVKDL